MTAGVPSSSSAGEPGEGKWIKASLVEEGGGQRFKLAYRGETVVLHDGGALNRWAAIGITERHNLTLLADGVSIDGKKIHFTDPHAVEELEKILNAAHQSKPAAPVPHGPGRPHHHADPAEALVKITEPSSAGPRFIVTRDGFDFHVRFRTKFGELKTERLDTTLETFQNMGLFKPHISLQKIGIRLTVTRWDGVSFIEEPGLADLEASTPEDVHALIERCLQGGSDEPAAAGVLRKEPAKRRLVRVEVIKKPNEFRFHLVLHFQDETTEDGPLLVRQNLAKLQAEGFFQPGVFVSMTVMNDKVVVEHTEEQEGKRVKKIEALPLTSLDDARKVEAVFNRFLRDAGPALETEPEPPPTPKIEAPPPEPPPQKPLPASPAPAVQPEVPKLEPPAPPKESLRPAIPEPVAAATRPTDAPAKKPSPETTKPEKPAQPATPQWLTDAWRAVESTPVETVNKEVFDAIRHALNRPVVVNEHGCPSFTFPSRNKDGSAATIEVVLLAHYLLCTCPFGYLRFGPETRVFLSRLDDYIAFEHAALRGAAKELASEAVAFVVSPEFMEFLNSSSTREYKTQAAGLLLPTAEMASKHDLIWPLSREERLFQLLAKAAETYGLPVQSDAIVLDPGAPEFVGFRKAPARGLEFRDGNDFIRFAPLEVEICEDGTETRIGGNAGLSGWALDGEGRVCALYDEKSGFSPPDNLKLLRFVKEHETETAGLNILARLGSS